MNDLLVNRVANTPWIVAHSMRMYKISCTLLTTRFTNWIVQNTFGRVFSGG
jgi:hypothetical protein